MALDKLFGTTVDLVAKNLDLRAKNHLQIAANISNTETPGYIPKTLSFEQELKGALGNGGGLRNTSHNQRHIPLRGMADRLDQVQGTLEEVASSGMGRDGNGVDLEREMGRMAENQILFNASVQILTKKFESLKNAIRGGN